MGLSQSCSGGPGSLWIWNSKGRASLFSEEGCLELGTGTAHPLLPPAHMLARWLQSWETAWLKGAEGWVPMSQGKEYSSLDTPSQSFPPGDCPQFHHLNTQLFFFIFLTFLWVDFLSLLACFSYSISPSLLVGRLYFLFLYFFSVCLDTLTCIHNLPKYEFNHALIIFL